MEFLHVVDPTHNGYNIFLHVFIRMVDMSHSISQDLNWCKYCIHPPSTSHVEVTLCHTDTRSGPCWLSISSTMQGPLGTCSRAVCRSHGNSDTERENPSGFFQEACRKLFLQWFKVSVIRVAGNSCSNSAPEEDCSLPGRHTWRHLRVHLEKFLTLQLPEVSMKGLRSEIFLRQICN